MRLLFGIFGCLAAQSISREILENFVNSEDLPAIPQTTYIPVQIGGTFDFRSTFFKSGLENFVLISRQHGQDWKTDGAYHFVANIRQSGVEIYDSAYTSKLTVDDMTRFGFQISISGMQKDDNIYYMVVAFGDLMEPNFEFELSPKVYQPTIYTGEFDVYYEMVDGKPELVCSVGATGKPDISFTTSLEFTQKGNTARAKHPSDEWFSRNRDTTEIQCVSPFNSGSVLRFVDMNDIKRETTPLLAGWTLEHTCGPVPNRANSVKLYAGNQFETSFLEFDLNSPNSHDGVSMTQEGDNLKFKGVEATNEMKAALVCAFKHNDNLIGFTTPTGYEVFDKPTPRLPVTATLNVPECGFDLSATNQQIGACGHTDNELSFPPTLLQWKITKPDGSVTMYPEDGPEETTHLPLVLKLSTDLEGAKATCLDSRKNTEEDQRETEPEGVTTVKYRKFTSKISIVVTAQDITCRSDAFPNSTTQCSDIQEAKNPDVILCPATFLPYNATCVFLMKDGSTMESETFSNNDCTVGQESVLCAESSIDDCPVEPPKLDETNKASSNSYIWIICFIIALIGGGVLVYLNKRKNSKDYDVTDTNESDPEKQLSEPASNEEKIMLTSGDDGDHVKDTVHRIEDEKVDHKQDLTDDLPVHESFSNLAVTKSETEDDNNVTQ